MYKVTLLPTAIKSFKKLDKSIQQRIATKIDKDIVVEPIPADELIEFIRDTKPKSINRNLKFFPGEINEVPIYV